MSLLLTFLKIQEEVMILKKQYVLINKVSEMYGYSTNAIRCKIKQGVWLQNVHWVKAPDGRIHFNLDKITKWIEGDISI